MYSLNGEWTDGWTDGQMDGWMDGRTDERTNERTDGPIILCPKFYLGALKYQF